MHACSRKYGARACILFAPTLILILALYSSLEGKYGCMCLCTWCVCLCVHGVFVCVCVPVYMHVGSDMLYLYHRHLLPALQKQQCLRNDVKCQKAVVEVIERQQRFLDATMKQSVSGTSDT